MSQHHQRDCIEILIEKARGGQINRRTFIQAMGLLAAVPLALRSGISWAADKPLVLVNWGGNALNAFRSAWTDSFTQSTGIPVRIDGAGPTEGAIRSQLASGRPSWDVLSQNPAGPGPAMQFIQHALQPAGQLKLFELLGTALPTPPPRS